MGNKFALQGVVHGDGIFGWLDDYMARVALDSGGAWRSLIWSFVAGAVVATCYYGVALADRSKPYDRIFGIVSPVSPTECGKPEGPIPNRIRADGGDCLRQEWTVDRRKACDVVPSDPYVYRWLIDRDGERIDLPVIPSLQTNGNIPRMSKTFIGPKLPAGWTSYRARVDVACPIDAVGMRDLVNPFQLRWPLHMDELSTEFFAEP